MTSFNNALHGLLAIAICGLTACGGGSGANAPVVVQSPVSGLNVLNILVDTGPAGTTGNVNRLYTEVTVCQVGGSQCQTIDHVLVDTGSTGLRILSSALSSTLALTKLTGIGGFPLLNCARFVDGTFAWGPVVSADVNLGAKTVSGLPVQIIADPAFTGLAAVCSTGTAITSAATLGAKGIIGLGLLKEDCGGNCVNTVNNRVYFTCTSAACSAAVGSVAVLSKQLKNPVPLFASDNNGVVIDLPTVRAPGQATLSGSLYFGVNTQANNQFTSGAVLTTSATGLVSTVFEGRTLSNSFIDTGSNGIYFDSSAIARCVGAGAIGFYCPASTTAVTARLVGRNAVTVPITFSVDNASALFASGANTAIPTLSGTINDALIFDWGLPFFFGRKVFIGIEGQVSAIGTGPYYAF